MENQFQPSFASKRERREEGRSRLPKTGCKTSSTKVLAGDLIELVGRVQACGKPLLLRFFILFIGNLPYCIQIRVLNLKKSIHLCSRNMYPDSFPVHFERLEFRRFNLDSDIRAWKHIQDGSKGRWGIIRSGYGLGCVISHKYRFLIVRPIPILSTLPSYHCVVFKEWGCHNLVNSSRGKSFQR